MNRRVFLRSLLGGIALLAGGGLWRMSDQGVFSSGKGPAYKPWDLFGEEQDVTHKLVSAAILASNPHNTQPWRFRTGPGRIELLADKARNLGSMDPFLREMDIGLGCALENMMIAAVASGLNAAVRLLPDGAGSEIAAAVEWNGGNSGGGGSSALYESIPLRHTNRGPFETGRSLPEGALTTLQELLSERDEVDVVWFGDAERRTRTGQLIVEATEAIIADREQAEDTHSWFRHDWDEMQRLRDGITIDASGNPPLTRALGKTLPDMSADSSNGYWLKSTRDTQVPTAAAFGMIIVKDSRSREQLLKAGRCWQRMHLSAIRSGLAMQPMNQPNERADREVKLGLEPAVGNALRQLVGRDGWQSVFTFRIGYPKDAALKSPRRAVEDVLV